MSQPLETDSAANKSSHNDLENVSESGSKSEEGSTASEDDVFLSIWFPSLPNFPTPYLCNQDFLDAERARRYITKHFNLENIREGLRCYPDLSKTSSTTTPSLLLNILSLSNDTSIKQFVITMPHFKYGQNISPDILCLMISILYSHSISYS